MPFTTLYQIFSTVLVNIDFLDSCTFLFFREKNRVFVVDLDETQVIANGRQDPGQIVLEENKTLHLSCYGNGNPNPTIRLSKHNGIIKTLETIDDKWLNHTIERLQCSDSDTYKCTSTTTGFQNKEKRITVIVQCEFLQFKRINSK